MSEHDLERLALRIANLEKLLGSALEMLGADSLTAQEWEELSKDSEASTAEIERAVAKLDFEILERKLGIGD